MTISKLYSMKNGDYLSPLDCKNINLSLASMSVSDIPKEQIRNVMDYITTALNIKSVEHSLVSKLDALLEDLRSTI